MAGQIGDFHALLLPGVAITHGHGLVFQRLMVDGDAERCSDFVLSREGQLILKARNRVPASRAVNSPLNAFPFEMIDPVFTLDEDQKWSKLWSELFLRGQRVPRDAD